MCSYALPSASVFFSFSVTSVVSVVMAIVFLALLHATALVIEFTVVGQLLKEEQ